MSKEKDNSKSVGVVQTQTVRIKLPAEGLELKKEGVLRELTVAYETYGKLSPARDNVVNICHALTGDAHVAGFHGSPGENPGWWDEMVGPGKGIDTNYYFVVCSNILGGCAGTTGPSSIDPATGKPYGAAFPEITVSDIVRVQRLLLETLGIDRLAAVVGGSLGGMQALEWAIRYPDKIDRCICIAAGASLSTQALAFDIVARDAILSDPNWFAGSYYNEAVKPSWGLSHARKIGHITYLSPEIMQKKFGREKVAHSDSDTKEHRFEVESYLDHQGSKLVDRFDANSYVRITEAMDSFDLVEEYGCLEKAFESVKSKFLVIGLSTDWLFPPEQSVDLANALHRADKRVSCCILEAPHGHDAFLVEIKNMSETVHAFLPWVQTEQKSSLSVSNDALGAQEQERYRLVVESVRDGARVLDLCCGNGELLSQLRQKKGTVGLGVDIDLRNVIEVIDKGHDVFQADLDDGLSIIPDGFYDYAILSSALQEVKRPRDVLREMVRVARECIITFPNFGNWRNRLVLGLVGRMPKSSILPHEWYDTPNIHLTTLKDFIMLCNREGIEVLDTVCIPGDVILDKVFIKLGLCNLGAERVLVRVTRRSSG